MVVYHVYFSTLCRPQTYSVGLVAKDFMQFSAIINDTFKISISSSFCIFRNGNFCVFIVYSATLLNSCINPNSYFIDFFNIDSCVF